MGPGLYPGCPATRALRPGGGTELEKTQILGVVLTAESQEDAGSIERGPAFLILTWLLSPDDVNPRHRLPL